MPKRNNSGGFKKIERKIKRALSGDMLKNALDFVAYMQANEMTLDIVTTVFSFLGKEVCCLTLDGNSHPAGPWSIYWMEYDIYEQDDYKVDEQVKKFALDHIHFCSTGHCDNSPGMPRMIFGNQYEHVCYCCLQFCMPDAEALENIKKLVELRKHNIINEIKRTE